MPDPDPAILDHLAIGVRRWPDARHHITFKVKSVDATAGELHRYGERRPGRRGTLIADRLTKSPHQPQTSIPVRLAPDRS
jgi:hypothetical protein